MSYSTTQAREIGDKLGIDFTVIDIDEFCKGLAIELEHGKRDPETNVTNDDPLVTGKITWAHLKELPNYYSKLSVMEGEEN